MSINGWMDKENVVSKYNRILFSSKKEGNPTICDMGGPGKYYAKWDKPVQEGQTMYDFTYMRYLKQSNLQKKKT